MKPKNEDLQREYCAPGASLYESMRAVGYDLQAAIADLIDNCITAKAKNIWVDFFWAGTDSWVRIVDDGKGMTKEELLAAMRLGSQNPREARNVQDLGRFGLGLKTASVSQCRVLTVCTRKKGVDAVRSWDLDYLERLSSAGEDPWYLLVGSNPDDDRLKLPDNKESGTIVLWEKLDRIVGSTPISDRVAQKSFLAQVDLTCRYLGVVFHRFLEGPSAIKIFVNGQDEANRVKAWDPFLAEHPSTHANPKDPIEYLGQKIWFKGFVLPHKDGFGKNEDAYKKAGGLNGWNAQQGFYVYRNKRLLVAGSWLGLGQNSPWSQEEHYKLARIMLDISNSTDHEWQIDVKKSLAVPPAAIRQRLISLAAQVRQQAREVYASRGRTGGRRKPRAVEDRPWIATEKNGHPVYKIDRNHPLVEDMRKLLGSKVEVLHALLTVLEQTVPIQRIWLDTAEKPDGHLQPFKDMSRKEIVELLRCTYNGFRNKGLGHEESLYKLSTHEGLADYPELIKNLENTDE